MSSRRPPLSAFASIPVVLGLVFLAVYQIARLVGSRTSDLPPMASVQSVSLGDVLTDFSLTSPAGASSLTSLLREPCVVVVFFEAHCPWCEKLAREQTGSQSMDGLEVYWVSVPSDLDATRQFAGTHGLDGRWAMMSDWSSVAAVGVRATPTAYLVGPGRTFLGEVSLSEPSLRDRCA